MPEVEPVARRYGSTHEDMRRHNLSTLLTLVHRDGPTSRTRLADLTQLNKSTIGALTKELLDLGLVDEIIPTSNTRVGRPSRVVAPNEKVVAIAVNPEFGAVTIGVVALGGRVLRRVRYATAHTSSVMDAVALTSAFVDGMRSELERDFRVVGVGVAVPGAVHSPSGEVSLAPHLGWAHEPLVELLEKATGYPVLADNDARLGSLAERTFGVGRGIDDLIFVNGWGHGISGGIISGGRAVSGFSGYAGAFGHVRTGDTARTDSAGIAGTLEAEVTRQALLDALGLEDADPDTLESALVAARTKKVRAVIERQLTHLATAVGTILNILNSEVVVLGGFLASLHAAAPEHFSEALAARAMPASFQGVRILPSGLGTNLLLNGAAELVFEALLDAPAAIRPS